MYKYEARRSPDEPEKGHKRGGKPEEGETDDKEGCVQEFLGDDVVADLDGFCGACCACAGVGWGERRDESDGQIVRWVRGDAPNLFIAANPPNRNPSAMSRSGLVMLSSQTGEGGGR